MLVGVIEIKITAWYSLFTEDTSGLKDDDSWSFHLIHSAFRSNSSRDIATRG